GPTDAGRTSSGRCMFEAVWGRLIVGGWGRTAGPATRTARRGAERRRRNRNGRAPRLEPLAWPRVNRVPANDGGDFRWGVADVNGAAAALADKPPAALSKNVTKCDVFSLFC